MKIIKTNTKDFRKDTLKAEKPLIVLGGDEKLNRLIVESKHVDILLSPEIENKKDNFHYRKSGLNQVLCKLAKKNEVAVGFDFCLLINSNGEKRSQIIGKMMQNMILCKKYKNKIKIGCFTENELLTRNDSVLVSFGVILGLNEKEAKNSLLK